MKKTFYLTIVAVAICVMACGNSQTSQPSSEGEISEEPEEVIEPDMFDRGAYTILEPTGWEVDNAYSEALITKSGSDKQFRVRDEHNGSIDKWADGKTKAKDFEVNGVTWLAYTADEGDYKVHYYTFNEDYGTLIWVGGTNVTDADDSDAMTILKGIFLKEI
ncbi:MAG: hypothetical protein J5770_02910 [Bacteroidaceae bacterium]|nr:hypothetical protein [Bacteroidaceae bacterium]